MAGREPAPRPGGEAAGGHPALARALRLALLVLVALLFAVLLSRGPARPMVFLST
ncbi:hypothetical protein QJS66_12770 [Kocuria rhizophila]|nr:hypothetical protein QJS66_12770 [Kocuria rhizophila]